MAREQSPNEVEKEMIEVLGPENGMLFYSIQNDFIFLVEKFKHFKELFMTDRSRIELMKNSASFFFYSLQKILVDDLVMNISRLTEAEKYRKYRNATIKGFIKSFKPEELNPDIYQKFNTSLKSINVLNDWRDKRVGHRDFEVHANNAPISIKYDEIDLCMENLKQLMRSIHSHFFQSDFLYDMFTPTGGAMSLMNKLDFAIRSEREYYDSQKNRSTFNVEAIRPGYKSFK